MKRVLTAGFFDGVHLGHGELLTFTSKKALELGVSSAALTFDKHPKSITNGKEIPLLCAHEEKLELITSLYRLTETLVEPFTADTGLLHWSDYLEEIFIAKYNAVHIVVGHDFRFGNSASGTPELLEDYCKRRGLGCTVIPPKCVDGVRVSSTHIRELISKGHIEQAAKFLGRPYRLSGVVERGRGFGRSLGFPTLNFPLPAGLAHPLWGVYQTNVIWRGSAYKALTNIGNRPSFGGGKPFVETTIFDFDQNLYGELIHIDLIKFIRSEEKFSSAGDLIAQIEIDIKSCF